jgi:ribonuclease P/MRP protein subunit RPP20
MFFSLDELVHWLGLTVFEIWINLISLSIFTVLLSLHLEGYLIMEERNIWWVIFSPLFTADALNAYFCTIVLIRMYIEGLYKAAFLRALWSYWFLGLLFAFEFLLCRKLSNLSEAEYSEILAPIFILQQLIAVRACTLFTD